MKRFRIIACLLACLLVLPFSLVACNDPGAGSTETSGADTDPIGTAEPGEDQLGIPEDLTYGGEEFVILGWSDEPSGYDFYEGGDSDQKIQSAIYKRNEMVKYRLDIEISYKTIPGNNANKDAFVKSVQNNSLTSDESAYDLVACYSMCAINLAINDLLVDMSSLTYPEFEKSWWSQSLMENCKLGDGIYFCSGDLATSTMMQSFLIAVNMDQLANYENLEDPRELVNDGTWTYETLFAMTKDLGIDKNDNSVKDVNDSYGLIASGNAMWDSFYIGSEMSYLAMDSEGVYDLSFEFESEKTYDLMEYLKKEIVDGKDVANMYDYTIFTRGDALFAISELSILIQQKKNITFQYSFVPVPKYDVEQKNYYTTLGFPFSFYGIPENVSDVERASVVLELMEYESNRQLRPAVFDAVKYQQSNDGLDADMFDTIINGVTYDLGRIMHGVFEGLGGDGWKASPVMIFRRGVIYGENLYAQIVEFEGPLNEGLGLLNDFKKN